MTTFAARVADTSAISAVPTNYAPEIRETHTAVVMLLGDRAYKFKKPVITDFADFSAVATRARVCSREVALNRRLAPSSYVGVGHFHGPHDRPAEPVVVMRRYPDHQRLRTMIERGAPTESQLSALAKLLAEFHADAARSPHIDACASLTKIAERWQENLNEVERVVSDDMSKEMVSEIRRLAMRYISGRASLFKARISANRIVDGHGDLLADDIFCTDSGPIPLDCLEFDDQLRYIDGIDDAAFLAMDLEFLGRQDLANHFLDCYRAHARDSAPRSLVDFYIAYRAIIRAKVDFIRIAQGHATADVDCRSHLQLALKHLQRATVRMILVGGGPGTGKSTLAGSVAEIIDAEVISTDVVRRDLQHSGVIGGDTGDLDTGLYAPENVALVYEDVLKRAVAILASGRSVILDGTWRTTDERFKASEAARQACATMVEFVCLATLSVAQDRIEARKPGLSDINAQLAADISRAPWSEAHPIDTSRSPGDSAAEVAQICRTTT